LHIIYIYKDVPGEIKEIKNWIAIYLIELLSTLFTIIFLGCTMIFTTGLWIYHIKLICRNMTTKEEIKKLIFDNIGNTYDFGVSKNCKDFWSRHRIMEDDFTVKDLRTKMKIQNINNEMNKQNVHNKGKKQIKILFGMSKKEQQLKNKNKKELNDKNNNKNNDNKNNNKIEKKSNNEEKEENEEEFDNISIDSEKTDDIQNNDQIFKNIKQRIQNKIKSDENKDKNSNK
jgi:hypothetical protein